MEILPDEPIEVEETAAPILIQDDDVIPMVGDDGECKMVESCDQEVGGNDYFETLV